MRIGLIGWGTRTGIGIVNWSLWRTGRFDAWLMPHHPQNLPMAGEPGPGVTRCSVTCRRSLAHWMKSIDVAVFLERPFFDHVGTFREARKEGKRFVLVPMHEWLPHPTAGWLQIVDHVWCPVAHCFEVLSSIVAAGRAGGILYPWAGSIFGGRWGIELDRWKPIQRGRVNRFIFSNGNGGVLCRKGSDILLKAARIARRIPITIQSQVPVNIPVTSNVTVIVKNNLDPYDNYTGGDVCVQPSRWEGLGLSLYEAQATATPVMTTDAPPMNEVEPAWKIPVGNPETINLGGRKSTFRSPNVTELADLLEQVHGSDVSQQSEAAFARSRKWGIGDVVDDLIRSLG